MAKITLSQTTPTATKATPTKAKLARVNTAAYIAAVKSDTKTVAAKARVVGVAMQSGVENKTITADLTEALERADMVVPKSLSASVTHYATAYAAASVVGFASIDAALHAAYQISTGEVRASVRDKFIAEFDVRSSAEAFISGCRALIADARKAKKAGVSDEAADSEGDDIEEAPISPVKDFRAGLKQLSAMLDLAAQADDDSDYCTMLDEMTAFAGRYLVL